MTSPPPTGGSKRKLTENAVQEGIKRLKNYPTPNSTSIESLLAQPPNATAGPPSTLGSSTPSLLGLIQSSLATSRAQHSGPSAQSQPTGLGVQATGAKGSPAGRLKAAATSGLESALRALHINADLIPPLKPAINELVGCLDIAATTSAEEYNELTSELAIVASTLKEYLVELNPEDKSSNAACERIALSMEAEVAHIKKQEGRSKTKRALKTVEDRDDVIKRYRRVESLFRQLQAFLLQSMSPVDDAVYDSSYSTTIKRRECTAETRRNVQAELQDWVRDPNGAKVYWMNGTAGAGKTTIAYSLCNWLEKNQQLGGSFFCSRVSSSCRDVNGIISTIAYQLALYSPAFRSALCNNLENEPRGYKRNVVRQFEKLVQEPIMACKNEIPEGVVVVIDALDKCEDDYGIRLILGTLLKLGSSLPLKFFVTSRPEPAIRNHIQSSGLYLPPILHLDDVDQSVVESDIRKYLMEEFQTMSPLPSNEQIGQLAKLTGNLFINAATIVRYILSGKGSTDPKARLDSILRTAPPAAEEHSRFNKQCEKLDELYIQSLGTAFDVEAVGGVGIEPMQRVLWTIVCVKEPMTVETLAAFLSISEGEVLSAIERFSPVLHTSKSSGLISTLHASFPDFLLDWTRSGEFYCDKTKHSELLTNRCFRIMKEQLRFNICGLESSFVFDEDVPDLDQRIEANIPPVLFYACRYWGEHLHLTAISAEISKNLVEFLENQLLFWMELLNLKKCLLDGVSSLGKAEQRFMNSGTTNEIKDLISEARIFVARFAAGACGRGTPHVYISALSLCAYSSSVSRIYREKMRNLLELKGTAMGRRSTAAQATWITTSGVTCVNYSPDGMRVVSGFLDGTVQVWDARTGDVVAGPFHGHTHLVWSVAFSPEGKRVVSGAQDKAIRVWDAYSGDIIAGPFRGHTDSVNSVAFSPDGTRIVSGSSDKTVQVWDAYTGDVVAGPFHGHTATVWSVAFSPNGAFVVSGSHDRTARVWNAYTGNIVAEPFQGHKDLVWSVAFSPDGARIASGSEDGAIFVWDAHGTNIIAGPFRGHAKTVISIDFSPDGARIVSACVDGSIRVWDTFTGEVVAGPLQGHTNIVWSVAFSPNNSCVVSGSFDDTIRLWETHINNVVSESFRGHKDIVMSVALSPDGMRIASGSNDRIVQVINARTGDITAGPFQGHTFPVWSVAFSPNGRRIVSGSLDSTIRLWDARTGEVLAGPFRPHSEWVGSVAFSPDGTRIVSGSYDKTILVLNAHSGNVVVGPLRGHTAPVHSVAFSPSGKQIVSGSGDKTVQLWDAWTGNAVTGAFCGHTDEVWSVSFSPDGTRVVSGSKDTTVRVWDVCTREAAAEPFRGHIDHVWSVAFSPNGSWIVSGSHDNTLRLWDAQTGDTIAGPFQGHTGPVRSVAFFPDGMHVVSSSHDLTIRVWDTRTGDLATNPPQMPSKGPQSITHSSNHPPESLGIDHSPPHWGQLGSSYLNELFTFERQFEVDRSGWVMSDGLPLFWVPPDLRDYIPHPRTTLLTGPLGTLSIDYGSLLLGERWSECYVADH